MLQNELTPVCIKTLYHMNVTQLQRSLAGLQRQTLSYVMWLFSVYSHYNCLTWPPPPPESLFQLLLETTVRSTGPNDPTGQAITALSCACLFSLVVAWGDTGKILQAVSAILTNNGSHACQTIQVDQQFKSVGFPVDTTVFHACRVNC